MKIYTQTFDLAQPMPKMFSVAQNSEFGIGIKIVKNGVAVEDEFTVAVDGETLTPEADKISDFTIYILNSGDADKTYTVTCKGQTFKLTQNTTESSVFDLKPAPEPAEKYGVSIDNFLGDVNENGLLLAPTTKSYELKSDEILRLNAGSVSTLPKTNLTAIDLPNLVQWGGFALFQTFNGCTSLTSLKLGLTSLIPPGMMSSFKNCTGLKSVDLSKLSDIAESSLVTAFEGCTSLEYVNLSGLREITSQDGMQQTFKGCTSLKYIDMSNLSSIPNSGAVVEMFLSCTSLQYVDFRNAAAVPTPTGYGSYSQMFYQTNDSFKIIVPDALYDSWIASSAWYSWRTHIVKASEYPVVMTQYGGQDNMDNI